MRKLKDYSRDEPQAPATVKKKQKKTQNTFVLWLKVTLKVKDDHFILM